MDGLREVRTDLTGRTVYGVSQHGDGDVRIGEDVDGWTWFLSLGRDRLSIERWGPSVDLLDEDTPVEVLWDAPWDGRTMMDVQALTGLAYSAQSVPVA